MQGPCGTWFSGDTHNFPAGPQALVFDPFPNYPWVCFETCPYSASTSTFTGVILQVGYVGGDSPARSSTWGHVKAQYR